MTAEPLLAVGVNHRSSSAALRDQLFIEEAAVPALFARLRGAGIAQAVVLSTCDRVEVLALAEEGAPIIDLLAAHGGLAGEEVAGQFYVLRGAEALRHIFAVAASLDSQMIGEPQVLGQVKAAHRMARDFGMIGGELEAVLQGAYATAKRVRAETAIAARPVSIAAAAVQLARDVHGALEKVTVLVVGAGDMGELVAQQMRGHGAGVLLVAAPSATRAEAMARRLQCAQVAFADLPRQLAEADIVITAVGARQATITATQVGTALKRRRWRPMLLIDVGIPGDVEAAVNRIDEAFFYNIDDLEGIAMEGRATREAAALAAWEIVRGDAAAFLQGRAARAAVPALVALRRHVEALRLAVLAETTDADRATRLLAGRLLHHPSEALRCLAAEDPEAWRVMEEAVRRLFPLDITEDDNEPG